MTSTVSKDPVYCPFAAASSQLRDLVISPAREFSIIVRYMDPQQRRVENIVYSPLLQVIGEVDPVGIVPEII